MKFKVGDVVRWINPDYPNNGPKHSEIFTLTSADENFVGFPLARYDFGVFSDKLEYQLGRKTNWSVRSFELVKKETPEELLKIAKNGLRARNELLKLGILERQNETGDWFEVERIVTLDYRIKPKKEFKPFKTSNHWSVSLKDEELHIGCQSFPKEDFNIMLDELIRKNVCSCGSFFSSKNGIKYGQHLLSWQDAEKILNALNEYEEKNG